MTIVEAIALVVGVTLFMASMVIEIWLWRQGRLKDALIVIVLGDFGAFLAVTSVAGWIAGLMAMLLFIITDLIYYRRLGQ
jgi:hypothetical protein